MIRYTLKCDKGHQFDSWFQSADAFETLIARGLTECTACGSKDVTKALMAPRVSTGDSSGTPDAAQELPEQPTGQQTLSLTEPSSPLEKAISKLRKEVEKNSDYVGVNFASEARRMHEGDMPLRAIHGEANAEDARGLIEDGVPVMPLPFGPRDKAN
ncbi:MAG: DUF1178 family protein [Pseudomonadota bacterium]